MMVKKIIRYCLFAAGLFVVALGALLLWAQQHEDELKQKAIQSLESGLLTDMNIGTIEYSVIEHFPNVSLVCNDVMLTDTYGKGDTLLWAGKVSFELGLRSLWQKDLSFKQVRISDGGMHIHRDAQARDNFHFWQTQEDDSSSAGFAISEVKLRNIHFRMVDEYAQVNVETKHVSADLNGEFEDGVLDFQAELETTYGYVKVGEDTWLPGLPLSGEVVSSLDIDSSRYHFPELDLNVHGMKLVGDAGFDVLATGVRCSVHTAINDADIAKLRANLPPSITQQLQGLETDGVASGTFALDGLAEGSQTPAWSFNGKLRNGYLAPKEAQTELNDISANVEVSGGSTSTGSIRVSGLSADLKGNRVVANFKLDDFNHPWISGDLRSEFELNDAQQLLALDSIGNLYGELDLNVQFSGRMPYDGNTKSIDLEALKAATLNGSLEMDNITLDLVDLPRPIENLEGQVNLNGDLGSFEEVELRIDDTDLSFQGTLTNLLPWLIKEGEVLEVDARCDSESFSLASFLTEESNSSTTENSEDYQLELPQDLDLSVDLHFEHFHFRQFSASEVNGKASLNKNGIQIEPLRFETSEGNMQLTCSARPNASGFRLSAQTSMSDIDLRSLFVNFENFGQDFITYVNVEGLCNAEGTFEAQMTPQLEIVPKSIESKIGLRVDNGELIGLQSMQHISAYMQENKLISPFVRGQELEQKLRHIHFETLENQIDIRNGLIHFPTMDIHSSAMDITVSGTHAFDQSIDYSLALYLRDILIQKRQTEFGEVEDDGLGNRFFLSMTGTTDNPQFGYDRLARKEQKKIERQEEKESFKQLLREELGIGKKKQADTTPDETPTSPSVNISVDWGDETDSKPEEKSTQPPKDEKKKRRWKLLQSDEEDEYEAPPEEDDDF